MTPLYRGFAHFTRKNVPHRNKTAARSRAAGNIFAVALFVRAEFFVVPPLARLYHVRPCFSYPAGVQPLFGVGVGHRTFSNGPYRRRLVRGGYARKYGPGSAAAAIATGNGSTPPSPSDTGVIGANSRQSAAPAYLHKFLSVFRPVLSQVSPQPAQHVLFIFRLAKFQVKPCPRTYSLHPAAAFVNSVGQVCGTYFCRL